MDTSSKKTNNDSAAQPTTSQQQVLHKAAPAGTEQADLMGWEMASRRQRGRDVIEGSPPGNQPARKDMRTQQQEGLLTASAASNKQKQTAPPRGNATGQPAATQRAGQKPKQVQQQRKNGKEPAAGASPDAPPPAGCHLQQRPSPPYRPGPKARRATWRCRKRISADSRQYQLQTRRASQRKQRRQGRAKGTQWQQPTLQPVQKRQRQN